MKSSPSSLGCSVDLSVNSGRVVRGVGHLDHV